jgi:beta-glucanase (GH16 family)
MSRHSTFLRALFARLPRALWAWVGPLLVVGCMVVSRARGSATFFEDWAGEVGQGPDSAWGAENATDPNNSAVHYTNVTPAHATAANPSTIQVINDPTAKYGQALQMTLMPNPNGNGTYLSSEISTRIDPSKLGNNIEYGHIEASIKIPGGSNSGAIWPAFWMLGDDISSVGWPACGEIDVMENAGYEPGTVQGHIHGLSSNGQDYYGGTGVGGSYTLADNATFYSGYHTFAVDWSPNSITFSVDGHPYETVTPASLPAGATWEFNNHPFYLILDVNEGGGFAPGTITTPQVMDIAYVSVSVPEPANLGLIGVAAGGLLMCRRRCRTVL